MSAKKYQGSYFLLQIAVGIFFLLLGLQGIMHYNSDISGLGRALAKTFGGKVNYISITIAVLELISGVIILGGLFVPMKNSTLMIASLAVFIFWAVRIAYSFFVNNFTEPDLLTWLQSLSLDCVVLMSVWIIQRKYS